MREVKDRDIDLNSSAKPFNRRQENLFFSKETPRFMEESGKGHAKKLSNLNLNIEEI